MIKIFRFILISALISLGLSHALSANDGTSKFDEIRRKEFHYALDLIGKGMFNRAETIFTDLARRTYDTDAEAYSIYCDIKSRAAGYQARMQRFINEHPSSALIPAMRYQYAMNLFAEKSYAGAAEQFDLIKPKHLSKSERPAHLFFKAYSYWETSRTAQALADFKDVEAMPESEFSAPARYAIAYIYYEAKDFKPALHWFEKTTSDIRFKEISQFYILDCKFMLKDHDYIIKHGPEIYENASYRRKSQIARFISESYLIKGDAENARKYFELTALAEEDKTANDYFYAGSLLYASGDYKAAIDNFTKIEAQVDSLGQMTNYHLGYSYLQTKNKVAALDAFKLASQIEINPTVTEDAYFNYAKLAFDLNTDTSVFEAFLRKYYMREKSEQIYNYMAVAALHNRDYGAAIAAYDNIEELKPDMKPNYVKANYLRASQLIESGSYRRAMPYLKTVTYFSDKNSRISQLARYWMGEAHYRDGEFPQAREIFTSLYNLSALYGEEEYDNILYNIAYCFFMEENYPNAIRWFDRYVAEGTEKYKKDAMERKADSYFVQGQYLSAAKAYDEVSAKYFDINDIYPYYQAALSYGLSGDKDKKINILSKITTASPQADFYDNAMYELGRAYVEKNQTSKAYSIFKQVTETSQDVVEIARATIELGMLARNNGENEDALKFYKKVIEEYPSSGFVEDALLAIESIYASLRQSDTYLSYIESIGKGATKTPEEKENIIFNTAEQHFNAGDYAKALFSLQSYLNTYPTGKHVYRAKYYIAEVYREQNEFEKANDLYAEVIEKGEGSFVELSMMRYANISYNLQKYEEAYQAYSKLLNTAHFDENKKMAKIGMMRSSYNAQNYSNAIKSANRLLEEKSLEEALKREAQYYKAKSYLITSMRDEAFTIFKTLSKNLSDSYGAEAAYLLILDHYDKGEFNQVQEKVFAFSDAGSRQTYWLAKAFITLGDTYMELDRPAQAKATFESIRDGYKSTGTDDDVLSNVDMRLKKLSEL